MKNISLFMIVIVSLCMSDQRHFVWTYEYKTVPKGEVEFEHYYTTSYLNSSDLSYYTKIGHQLEFEIGMNERFDFAIYHQFEQQEAQSEHVPFSYKGFKLRWRYRMGDKDQYLLDPLLYFEYQGKPDFSDHAIESKLILSREINNMIVSINPVIEIEIEEGKNEIETEYAAGITYKFNRLLHAGIEFKGSKNGHYWGPTISHGDHDSWISLGSAIAMGDVKDDKYEMEIRMIMGIGLK